MNKEDAQRVLDAINSCQEGGYRDVDRDWVVRMKFDGSLVSDAAAIMEAEVADHADIIASIAIPTEKLPATALLATMTFAPDIGPPPVDLPIGLIEPAEASPEMVTPYISREHFDRAFPAEKPDAWQPIETAPKDGTEIVLCRGNRVGAAAWVSHKEYEGWTVGQDGNNWDDPNLWMPLPKGPPQ